MKYSFEIYEFLSFATKIWEEVNIRQKLFDSAKKASEIAGDLTNRKTDDVVAKSYNDIKNTRTTSEIPQASLILPRKRQYIVD